MKKVVVTGIGGFVGAHILEYFLEKTNWNIIGIDSFRHKGTYSRLNEIIGYNVNRVRIFNHDLIAPIDVQLENQILEKTLESDGVPVDYIINIASDSAVERSITDPGPCWMNNCSLIFNMLEFARRVKPKLYLHFSCYDEKTRALTSNGFKNYWELNKNDEILTLNPISGFLEYKPIEEIIVQDYEGDMYHFDYARTDIKVTSNHRMLYEENCAIKVGSAEELSEKTYTYKLPKGKWKGIEHPTIHVKGIGNVPTIELFHLCGLYIGDGFTAYQEREVENKSGLKRENFLKECRNNKGQFISKHVGEEKTTTCKSYRIWIDIPENDSARKKTCETLDKLGIKYHCQKNKSGEHVYFTSQAWLEFFDKNFGTYAENKHIPQWMLEYDAIYLEKLFEGLLDSDGNEENRTYTTVSPTLVRDICELAIKIGYFPHYKKIPPQESVYQDRIIKGNHDCYYITCCKTHPNFKKDYLKIENYNGKIWCLKIKDNKNFIIERNGKLAICGNTDEVYGEAEPHRSHFEWDVILPSNPYSASKAAQEALAISYWRTYDVPLLLLNVMNIIGEWQDKEKFLPKLIYKVATNQKMQIYGEPGKIGSRYYIHANNIADAIIYLSKFEPAMYGKAKRPDRYNVVGDMELDNLQMAQYVAKVVGQPLNYELIPSEIARRGYDKRYALDGAKLAEMGWRHPKSTLDSIAQIVRWTMEHPHWLV